MHTSLRATACASAAYRLPGKVASFVAQLHRHGVEPCGHFGRRPPPPVSGAATPAIVQAEGNDVPDRIVAPRLRTDGREDRGRFMAPARSHGDLVLKVVCKTEAGKRGWGVKTHELTVVYVFCRKYAPSKNQAREKSLKGEHSVPPPRRLRLQTERGG